MPRTKPPFSTDPEGVRARRLAGLGMTHDRIAAALNIDPPTLRSRWKRELERGPAVVQAAALEALLVAAEAGDVDACLQVLACVPRPASKDNRYGGGADRPPRAAPAAPAVPDVAVAGLGKKAAANVIAQVAEAGTEWEGLLHAGDGTPDDEDEGQAPVARRPARARKAA